METYITLLKFTDQGVASIQKSDARLHEIKHVFKKMKAEVVDFYLTLGEYDAVVISKAPDAETIAKLALMIGSQGKIRTVTLRSFPEEEFRSIISALVPKKVKL
ncbi:MAG: GYD domain-containing protein [Calditrichaeota bacterium]|nr:MAG: GYD domain-containing protein [Calditrichota bacterium]MBL1207007.1 GYD domain-containing protein [Calditrichota bacterium]NOG46834.1 GYD domain-containing protein [Calditrichota bacterium]